MVRGLLNDGLAVVGGFKIGDIDPRGETPDFTSVSYKARAIGVVVLEALMIRAPAAGIMRSNVKLGDLVKEGDVIAWIGEHEIKAPLTGMVRGLLNDGLAVVGGFKIGDIDPRGETAAGIMRSNVKLGDLVKEGDVIAWIGEHEIKAPLTGMVRGLLNDGLAVVGGFKIGDIDPRGETADFTSVSDKARAIGGGVLEALMMLMHQGVKATKEVLEVA